MRNSLASGQGVLDLVLAWERKERKMKIKELTKIVCLFVYLVVYCLLSKNERNSEQGKSLPRCNDGSWQGLTLFTIALVARKLIDHDRDWPCSLPRQWEGN